MAREFPKPKGDPVDHYWLAMRMAQATGVDLAAAMADGALTQEDWSGVVERCRSCGWELDGGGCGRWLALQDPGTATPPKSCVNETVFADLIAGEG